MGRERFSTNLISRRTWKLPDLTKKMNLQGSSYSTTMVSFITCLLLVAMTRGSSSEKELWKFLMNGCFR